MFLIPVQPELLQVAVHKVFVSPQRKGMLVARIRLLRMKDGVALHLRTTSRTMIDKWRRNPATNPGNSSTFANAMDTCRIAHLCRIVHLSRQLRVKESHQLGQRHPNLPWSSFMRRRRLFTFSDMVE
jgi:hypothetical protein